jgi:hypothetical protein
MEKTVDPHRSGFGHWGCPSNFHLVRVEPMNRHPVRQQVCQNIDIQLSRLKNGKSEASSHFLGDFMANLWSGSQSLEQALLWTLRWATQANLCSQFS